MELRHLRYFVAAAEEENLTRAAVRLRVSQPPLSRQIRDLEEELGVVLFRRGAKSIQLTAAGRVFLSEARAVLERAEEALRTVRSLAEGVDEEIQVGYAPSLTVELLPKALRLFHSSCPAVKVQLHDLSTGEMVARLKEGGIDLALMIHPGAQALVGLEFTPLRRDRVFVAFAPGHPLGELPEVGLPRLAGERLVAYSRSEYPEYHAWLVSLFSSNRSLPCIAEEHDGSTGVIASVESGLGVALVQEGFERLSGGRLVLRPLTPPPAPFVTGLASRTGSERAALTRFKEAIVEAAVAGGSGDALGKA